MSVITDVLTVIKVSQPTTVKEVIERVQDKHNYTAHEIKQALKTIARKAGD